MIGFGSQRALAVVAAAGVATATATATVVAAEAAVTSTTVATRPAVAARMAWTVLMSFEAGRIRSVLRIPVVGALEHAGRPPEAPTQSDREEQQQHDDQDEPDHATRVTH
jgi:hypothetical protein